MVTVKFEQCPVCATDLRGLPAPARCPNCGFGYDEHTRVWRSDETWRRVAVRYMVMGLGAGLFISVIEAIGYGEAPRPVLPLVLGLLAPVGGLLLRRMVSGRISGRFVALTPDGIVVGTLPRARVRLIHWEDFERIEAQYGVIKLRRRNSPVPMPLDDIFNAETEAADFRAALDAAAREHRRPR
jgi:hypothetical protein